MHIVCDKNCNNLGNYFKVIGHEREVKEDKTNYIVKEKSGCTTHYPKGHCYRATRVERIPTRIMCNIKLDKSFDYSEAINYLIPKDYVRWQKTRFGGLYNGGK